MVKKDKTLAQKGVGPARQRKRACRGSFTKTAHRLHLLQLDATKDIVATTVVTQATIGKVGVATTTFVFARLKIDSLSVNVAVLIIYNVL